MISRRSIGMLFAGMVVLTLGLAPAGIALAQTTGDVNFVLGRKLLDEDEWGSLDEHDAIGVEVTWGDAEWPFQIATDLLYSKADETVMGVDVEGITIELDLGVRRLWRRGRSHPYVGGGLAFIRGEVEVTGFPSEDETELGGWVGGGVYWRFRRRLNIGIALRYSSAEVDVGGGDIDLGGRSFGLTLGWGWPAN